MCSNRLYDPYVTLNVQSTITEEEVNWPKYEVSNFCVFSNVGFFNTLRLNNLLLNVLRLVRIFSTIEYMIITPTSLCLTDIHVYIR